MATFHDLQEGKVYAIGFRDSNSGLLDYGPLCEWNGVEFIDEDGEPVRSFYDPDLGVMVAVNAADDYCEQL